WGVRRQAREPSRRGNRQTAGAVGPCANRRLLLAEVWVHAVVFVPRFQRLLGSEPAADIEARGIGAAGDAAGRIAGRGERAVGDAEAVRALCAAGLDRLTLVEPALVRPEFGIRRRISRRLVEVLLGALLARDRSNGGNGLAKGVLLRDLNVEDDRAGKSRGGKQRKCCGDNVLHFNVSLWAINSRQKPFSVGNIEYCRPMSAQPG